MITLVEDSKASTCSRQGPREWMLRTEDLIVLFIEFNLLASQRTRVVSDVRGCLIWDKGVHAWLCWWEWVWNWPVLRILRLIGRWMNVLQRWSRVSLLSLEHLYDIV